ncbi:Hypothetical protein, putative [Bodo saltans]|uniref:Uncharacterized protein n=1 Tax=Bodo saltans TaxID=75058 RepID=A0A0S4JNA3_BODSA|nr:Hypothetical protein, putative [Bodo saltans]|eukprot:CUG90598.1 Hypothetical protein, putative [Bodo saltans]
MMQRTSVSLGSLRNRRPYWMLFLTSKNVDNWKIYTKIHEPEHQRNEMLYQTWLGGIDRPYSRPKCMAHQPTWLAKKRFLLRKPKLDNAETPMEKYVLEWHKRFRSFEGTVRPTPEDLHTAFDLVERPLDLSYACQLLHQCRNVNNIRLDEDTFLIFLEACLRVDRKDVASYALENADTLGFWYVDENCRKYVTGEQSWYKLSAVDGLYYPEDENVEKNTGRTSAASSSSSSGVDVSTGAAATSNATGEESLDDEIAKLQAELDALEKGL